MIKCSLNPLGGTPGNFCHRHNRKKQKTLRSSSSIFGFSKKYPSSDKEWQRMVTSGTTSGITNDNEQHNEWRVVKRVTKSDNEWQRVAASAIINENGTAHFKEWMVVILSMAQTLYSTLIWMAAIRVIK